MKFDSQDEQQGKASVDLCSVGGASRGNAKIMLDMDKVIEEDTANSTEPKPKDGFKYWTKDVNWKEIPEYDGENNCWSKIFVNMEDWQIRQFLALYVGGKYPSSKELLKNLIESKCLYVYIQFYTKYYCYSFYERDYNFF